MACLGLGGCWDLGLGFGAVARLRGHWLEGLALGGSLGSLAGCWLPPAPLPGTMRPLSPSRPARRASRNMAPGPCRLSTGGLAPGQPGPRVLLGRLQRPDAAAAPSRRAGPAPRPSCPVVGLGVRPTRLCHVRHPPSTHEHLSKIPGGRGRAAAAASGPPGSQCQRRTGDKSSIFPVLLGWRGALPGAPSRLPAALPAGCRVAEAPATPAGTEGTDDGGGHRRGAGGWHPGPALLCRPRGLAGATAAVCTAFGAGAAPRPPAPVSLPPSVLSALETSRGLCHLVPVTFASL